eukprot:2375434-Prymnesium_polylepis.2
MWASKRATPQRLSCLLSRMRRRWAQSSDQLEAADRDRLEHALVVGDVGGLEPQADVLERHGEVALDGGVVEAHLHLRRVVLEGDRLSVRCGHRGQRPAAALRERLIGLVAVVDALVADAHNLLGIGHAVLQPDSRCGNCDRLRPGKEVALVKLSAHQRSASSATASAYRCPDTACRSTVGAPRHCTT